MLVQLNEIKKILKGIAEDKDIILPVEYVEKMVENINEITMHLLVINQRNFIENFKKRNDLWKHQKN